MTRLIPKRFGAPYTGLNTDFAEYLIPDTSFTLSDNFSLRDKALETSNGWLKFTDQILEVGDGTSNVVTPLLIQEFVQSSGADILICITSKRAYRFDSSLNVWLPITQGATPVLTTLTAIVNPGDVTVTVVSTAGISNGDQVILGFGTSTAEYVIATNITATSFDIVRPSWVPAGTGAQFAHASPDEVRRLASMVFGVDASQVDFAIDQDVFYFTDGVNPVQKYQVANPFHVDLPGVQTGDSLQGIGVLSTPLKAKYIRIVLNFMIFAHLTENGVVLPNKFRWSQQFNYQKYENEIDGSGQAGAFLFNGPEFINRMEQLKRELFFYRDTHVEAISYVGLPDIFALRRTETKTGMPAFKALFNFIDCHIFLGNDDVWINDGVSFQRIGGFIKQFLFNAIDPGQIENVECFFMSEFDELWFTYSTTGDRRCNKAILYNTALKAWSGPRICESTTLGYYRKVNDLIWNNAPGTWNTRGSWYWNQRLFAGNFPQSLMGSDSGLIFALELDPNADGVSFTKRYQSKRTDCGAAHLEKSVQRIRVGLDPTASALVNIYLGTAQSELDPIIWKGPYPLQLAPGYEPYVYMDEYGRYFEVAIETQGTTIIQDVEIAYYPRSSI